LEFGADKHLLQVKHFGKEEGFAGIETCQNASFRDKDGTLWFGTVSGLTSFNPHNKLPNSLPPLIRITGVSLFYQPIEKTPYADHIGNWGQLAKPLLLPYNENHVSFDFTGINLSAPENVNFQWKLTGFDKSWSPPSRHKEATYSNLPPGAYVFEVKSCNEDGVWNKEGACLSFTILKPFWLKTWFLALASVSTLFLILILFRWRLNRIRKKSDAEKRQLETEKSMLELEQKALRLQMNPHFIFNALNSIQSQISENNEQSARYHLARFSKLMRRTLDNSRNALIPLEEEVQALENYLSLEQFSSGNTFDFEIKVDENIVPEEDLIPPMMIQPFVENCIIHGFKHLDRRGKIIISFNKLPRFLECSITDNGRGMSGAREEKKTQQESHHKSTALIVTQERLDLMNPDGKFKTLEIKDLLDSSGIVCGTHVVLRVSLSNFL
jgi:hypothetical protein